MRFDSACWEMNSRAPALPKCSSSAVTTKARMPDMSASTSGGWTDNDRLSMRRGSLLDAEGRDRVTWSSRQGRRTVEIVEIRQELHLLRLAFGQAYLWNDAGALTLIDTGIATSGDEIAEAIGRLGLRTDAVRRVVLTHYHEDHCGGAAAVAAWGEVEVLAHRAEAPVIRGEVPAPPRTSPTRSGRCTATSAPTCCRPPRRAGWTGSWRTAT
ncbi:MBL fold metallo-hydrolase [Nonomuraea thailandensis]